MSILNKPNKQAQSLNQARLEKWTNRELQLTILHEEIINKREALLRTSKNFLQKTPLQDLPLNNVDAAIRNDRLLKDINQVEAVLNDSLFEAQSPKFAYLQANYWSMVKNMYPIWQKSLDEV
ncbi:centrosomal protein 15 kDa-like [Physella acuta]|uniref:centrosomal protein 15 kDa-like n=1 Tax=Physella acuta TaxID=109671 RepID=UPI0027DAC44F|nr:centrosomal protein 15 kDa-like [Physella acuta]XP_059154820.1 centrosomal protein 15 kDa-like [Physella acuta]XP_059154822.1 centrosomal protein 15 kDa-like [Physella acuta]XP_059154823.1 centrosomal protein 15 kDa-like [Physella acuta]XP_059154824.1 centrosomal protein 15 kDa-like [Physella acuta]